jgi:FHA domain/Zinc-ribbon containing domain
VEGISPGTMAGAGSFACEECGYAIALHELDEIPACPRCEGRTFRRTAMFGRQSEEHPTNVPAGSEPEWVRDARGALVAPGGYLAFERDGRTHVLTLQSGWTRVGRSLSAHVRFDDPTVSRRHVLVYCDDDGAKALDDRSLNGLFVNGEQVDMRDLADGDELEVGRFRLYYLSLPGARSKGRQSVGAGVG